MLAAIGALRGIGGRDVIVAVPTASAMAVELVAPAVESLYCANFRGGSSFAVAAAYKKWEDVSGLAFQHSIYSNAFQIMLKYKT